MKEIVLKSIKVESAEEITPDGGSIKVITDAGVIRVFDRQDNMALFDKLKEGLAELLQPFRYPNAPAASSGETPDAGAPAIAPEAPADSKVGVAAGAMTGTPTLTQGPPPEDVPKPVPMEPAPAAEAPQAPTEMPVEGPLPVNEMLAPQPAVAPEEPKPQ